MERARAWGLPEKNVVIQASQSISCGSLSKVKPKYVPFKYLPLATKKTSVVPLSSWLIGIPTMNCDNPQSIA